MDEALAQLDQMEAAIKAAKWCVMEFDRTKDPKYLETAEGYVLKVGVMGIKAVLPIKTRMPWR